MRSFTLECVDWLLRADVKLLVLACNTATANALTAVRSAAASASVPVVGVVRPGSVSVAAATRSLRVGVIATQGTVASGAYPAAIREADPRIEVAQLACPELVPLVEAGITDGAQAETVVRGYLSRLLAQLPDIDTLLLGCTHYPLLRPVIGRVLGAGVSVVDSAFTTALAVEDLLDALRARAAAGQPPARRVATTGDAEAFRAVAARVFGREVPEIEAARVEAVARA